MRKYAVEYTFLATGKTDILAHSKRELNKKLCQLDKKELFAGVDPIWGVSSLKIEKLNGLDYGQGINTIVVKEVKI